MCSSGFEDGRILLDPGVLIAGFEHRHGRTAVLVTGLVETLAPIPRPRTAGEDPFRGYSRPLVDIRDEKCAAPAA